MTATFSVRRGSLYIDHDTYDRHFAPLTGIILLRDGADLLVMPVRLAGAGGYLVKIRNAAGDRVVDAADFFRSNGIEDSTSLSIPATWEPTRGAMIAVDIFAAN